MTAGYTQEMQQSPQQLQEQQALAIASLQIGVWTFDRETAVLTWNDTFRKQLGFAEGRWEATLDEFLEAIHPDERDPVKTLLLTADTAFHREWHLGSGTNWIDVRTQVLHSSSGIAQIVGSSQDISASKAFEADMRRAKEAAEQANAAKTSFLAHMSHEIRTPLSAIIGYADLLKRDPALQSRHVEYLDIIVKNGEALTHLIDEILDLSKVEAGKLELEKKSFAVRPLLQEVIGIFAERAQRQQIVLSLDVDPSLPEIVECDPSRLRQILVNIIGNAVKFTPQGYVRVHASGRRLGKGHCTLHFRVEDSGLGVSIADQSRLFEAFIQADGSTTRLFGGTGLGLSLSRRLARALGGDVRIENSQPGLGSIFAISVAARACTPSLERRNQLTIRKPRAQILKGIHVLLVEDSPDISLLIATILRKYGACVSEVQNGLEAVNQALSHEFHILLMDIQMPVMDGYTAIQHLHEAGYHVPVIALTAHAMQAEKKRTFEAGFSAHLTKPIEAENLVLAVAKHALKKPQFETSRGRIFSRVRAGAHEAYAPKEP